jgi:hypothetical protein
LSGQEAVGDVAIASVAAATIAASVILTPVVELVLLLEPRAGIEMVSGTVGSPTKHRLEAPFQRRVLFDMLAIFVERGRADAVELRRVPAKA